MTTNEIDTMAELFSLDPLGYTKKDLTTIVETLQKQRVRFRAGIKDAGKPASRVSKATRAQADAKEVTGNLDLSDLGL